MNRKAKRDWLRASKGLGNDGDATKSATREQRKAIFGGSLSFSQGLRNHFQGRI